MSFALQAQMRAIEQRIQQIEMTVAELVSATQAVRKQIEALEAAGKRRWFTLKDVRDAKADR